MAAASPSDPTVVPSHQRRSRHVAAGNVTRRKRAMSRQAGVVEPVTAERAPATSEESCAISAGSGDRDCTTDRCVAVRW